jgi:hypothetical protein
MTEEPQFVLVIWTFVNWLFIGYWDLVIGHYYFWCDKNLTEYVIQLTDCEAFWALLL